MKKIFLTIFLAGLLAAASEAGYNRQGMPGSLFVSIDARDAHNRPVESNFVFSGSVFSKIYSAITPFGVTRWRIIPFNSTKISRVADFKIPYVAALFFDNNKKVLLGFPERHLSGNRIPQISTLLLLLLTGLILSYTPNLQSKNEPRFRVPILIE